MIFDHALTLSSRQQLLVSGTSTNVVDLGQPSRLGNTEVAVVVHSAGGTDPTLSVDIEHADSSDGPFSILLGGAKKPASGSTFEINVSKILIKRYLRLRYTLGGTNPVFTVTAAVVMGSQSNRSYPAASR